MYNYIKIVRGSDMIKAGIIGATGYVGQQLVWLLHHHPECSIHFLTSHSYADIQFNKVYGQYTGFIQDKCIKMQEMDEYLAETDVVFIALPHGKAFDIAGKCLERGVKVIDIGADFRLKDADVYKQWYKLEHNALELLPSAVYGLPELKREYIKGADLIANPGCYTTASILAMAPLVKAGIIDNSSIIIDAKSGVSGAGRAAKTDFIYGEVNESFKAYGIASHRHTPEIEQELSILGGDEITLSFTPHLVPMNRGILATCYGNLKKDISEDEIYELYKKEYGKEYFIRILEELPQTRWVKGTNFCDIALRVDKRTNRVIVVSAIDNMVKGAAGQAIQNMNILFNIEENKGLELLAMLP